MIKYAIFSKKLYSFIISVNCARDRATLRRTSKSVSATEKGGVEQHVSQLVKAPIVRCPPPLTSHLHPAAEPCPCPIRYRSHANDAGADALRTRRPPEIARNRRQPVSYFVRVELRGALHYDVSMTTDRVRRDSVDFVLPSWVPGPVRSAREQIQAESFSVRDDRGDPVATRRISGTRWRLYPEDAQYLSVAYQIMPDPPSEPLPFRTRIDLHAGYALGAGLFGFLEGLESRPVRISFDLPNGWRASAPLQGEGPNRSRLRTTSTCPARRSSWATGSGTTSSFSEGVHQSRRSVRELLPRPMRAPWTRRSAWHRLIRCARI